MTKLQEEIKFHADHERACAKLGAKYVKDKNWRAAGVCYMDAENHKSALRALRAVGKLKQ